MKEIKISTLIQLILLLSDSNQTKMAEAMGISRPTLNNMIWKTTLRIDSIKRIFKASEFPFTVEFKNERIENFDYWSWSIDNPAKFEKAARDSSSLKNVKKHFQTLGESFNVIILNTKYIIK